MNNFQGLKQWHSTDIVEENGEQVFVKRYTPNSFEIKNESSWLVSNILQGRSSFQTPEIREVSVKDGYVKMKCITKIEERDKDQAFEHLITCAIELHSLIKSNEPHLRTKIGHGEYMSYLKKYVSEKINFTDSVFPLEDELKSWIEKQTKDLKHEEFTIVHRDLRLRHLLFSGVQKPTLIDWEFSNISEPSQDLAKLVFDGVVNHGQDFKQFFERVVDHYAYERKIPHDLLREKVLTFLPVIPLEHTASFILRKPEGYETEVKKDLSFIKKVYAQEN